MQGRAGTHTPDPRRLPPGNLPQASAEAIAARGAFTVALSGGSLVKSLAGLVGRTDVEFSKW